MIRIVIIIEMIKNIKLINFMAILFSLICSSDQIIDGAFLTPGDNELDLLSTF